METTAHNISYFKLNTRKYLMENRKTLVSFAATFLGFTMVSGIWVGSLGGTPGEGSEGIYFFIAGLICAIAASLTFRELITKEGRISLMMTPGSTADKYFPRVLTTVAGMVILAAVGAVLLRSTLLLTHGIVFKEWLPWNIGAITVQEDGLALGICALISMFLFNEGLFVFGSVAWPKRSFLKTICVFIILQMLLSLIVATIVKNWYAFSEFRITENQAVALGWCITVIIFAAAAGLFYWSFKKLQTAQVVTK